MHANDQKSKMYNNYNESFAAQIRNNPHQRLNVKKPTKVVTNVRSAVSGISKRQEDKPDPVLLEKYDNFYQTTKSLLVLFQIMGVMPIERSEIGKTTFR